MLEDVKTALRITNTAYDSEVQDLIESAQFDLSQSGVFLVDETDPLIKRAIITYAKANFGIDNPQADRFNDSYVMLKQHLSLSGDYNGYSVE
ncbi:head-tail connector protein [Oceanobacillus profundus]|uniref:head-tail connector protein n=1 Tax=Oceanobacillus profundus TaxID=372463 RepID=UPI0026E37C3E|nr:head-tail connector protein [Oceanobacillus profundus]MDO6451722.1 head-tail connector protein [Oceanobacillus profundus]